MFRKELKFILPEGRLLEVENRIKGALPVDENQIGDYYLIRSIYFDSPTDICYRENRAGMGDIPREKYRIRAYDVSDSKISAEVKIRYRDTISKQTSLITREMFEKIVYDGNYHGLWEGKESLSTNAAKASLNTVYDKYLMKIAGEKYSPKAIVEYKRTVYVYNPANVRITFDRDITASDRFEDFFEEKLHGIPAMEKGMHVLEIKYDEFLPSEIQMLLQNIELNRTSCSKYCLCRDALKKCGGK